MTDITTKIISLREQIKDWKRQNLTVGFVPTMGALHSGHESLIKKARKDCDRVVVSIFVNPIQFAPNEDFDKYPRQLESDREICSKNNVDLIFTPASQEMYPDEQDLTTVVPPSSYQDKLCGKSRIGHFNGVATVVLKLFNLVQPDKAYFGQKDAQQLIIIKKMVKDLEIPVEIVGCSIIRDADGLALSSRNAYLSSEDRVKALTLSKVLKKINEDCNSNINESKKLINNALTLLHPDVKLEYLEIMDINTLKPLSIVTKNALVTIAAKVGNVRLIDNLLI